MIPVRSPARSPWVLPEKAGNGGNAGALPEHEAQLLGRLLQGVNGGSSSGFCKWGIRATHICPCRTVSLTWLAPCMQDFLTHHWTIPNHKTQTSALQVAPSFGLELLISESLKPHPFPTGRDAASVLSHLYWCGDGKPWDPWFSQTSQVPWSPPDLLWEKSGFIPIKEVLGWCETWRCHDQKLDSPYWDGNQSTNRFK